MSERAEMVVVADPTAEERRHAVEVLAEGGHRTAEAVTGREALRLTAELPIWLLLLEVRFADMSGYEVCRRLRQRHAGSVAVMFVSRDRQDPCDRTAGLLVGADDYVGKPVYGDELLARARAIRRRMDPASLSRAAGRHHLTRREQEILRLLARGHSQTTIARDLVIASKTVSKHIEHILSKLDVRSRAEAIAAAYRLGLCETDAGDRAAQPPTDVPACSFAPGLGEASVNGW